MEDADSVVPLRPGFDIQVRGFNRHQVIEHLELLEDQLRLVTIDRNESAQLNSDLRKLCDDTRRNLDAAEQRLKQIESSDTGLPAASQRVQNMLSIAEEEVQTLRDQARRQAEIIRGTAETEARELLNEAQRATTELRNECSELVTEVEERRARLHREHDQKVSDLRSREQRLRQNIRNEYKRTMSAAQLESDQLIDQTRRQCGQWDAETEQQRLEALDEIRTKQLQLEELRSSVLSAMDKAQHLLDQSVAELRDPIPDIADDIDQITRDRQVERIAHAEQVEQQPVRLPEQRDDAQTYTIPIERSHTNGAAPQTGPARQN
ncbi:hypothetical protein [Saccharopolyspora spinosa]|uniref:DivIVA protein n=1 Tax=Saccharopolyspora spinosa TaxID=60894 RepID=A0A2N3XVN4_SACSN|nr:hypothetical protein [Saccharopolyspora spinosa]PKW14737.1 hypothetical protein A8926_2381 [Saccharopolyspora spinosa]